jgi:hypothetical protein
VKRLVTGLSKAEMTEFTDDEEAFMEMKIRRSKLHIVMQKF